MTEPEKVDQVDEKDGERSWMLIAAAVAVIAVPVIVGFALIRAGSGDQAVPGVTTEADGDGMGGSNGMGGTPTTGASAPTAEGVRPFSEIQATDITIEPGADGAVLRVDTTIDVACAVAFGPTEELGFLATDTDMAGGGHAVHQPTMRGLVDGATYFYRVQGTDGDGTLYQSPIMSFVYEAAEGSGPSVSRPGENVAPLARVSDVSSEFSDAYAAANAIDGDLATEWSSAGDGDDAYIVLEFPDPMLVQGVGFRTREMSDGTSITLSFTVTVDGGETFGPFEAGPGLAVAEVGFSGREIRFDVETSTGGNTGAVEVEVYGEPEM